MILPVVRLVGSDPKQLFESWLQVSHDLGFALSHLNDVAPHGRDYPDNLAEAVNEYDSIVQRLQDLKYEIDRVVLHLSDS